MAKGFSSVIAAAMRANLENPFAGISRTVDEPRPITALAVPRAACFNERKVNPANANQRANEPAHIRSGRATAKSARRFFKDSLLHKTADRRMIKPPSGKGKLSTAKKVFDRIANQLRPHIESSENGND